MGGPNIVNKAQRITALQIQSSAYGIPIPIGWGRGRLALNLIQYDGFTSIEHQHQQSGGKGGGSVTNIDYTYYADVIFGICDTAGGPIRGLNAIYIDKSVFSGPTCVGDAGFTALAVGNPGQPAWDYWEGKFPGTARGYDTTADLMGAQYQLNDSGGLQNHSGEVDFAIQVGGGIYDANPADIIANFLPTCIPQWKSEYVGSLTDYGTYCLAAGLLLSPLLDQQQQASSFIDELMTATNSMCWIRGDGTLQIKPLADAAVTGNGVTYTPDLTPIYDLTDADFIVDDPSDDPIKFDTPNEDDLFNVVQVSFKNRQHQYNDETVTAQDQASADEIGQRKQDPTSLPSIKDPVVARLVAQLLVQQSSSLARPFTFNLPWCFDRLEEMDLVTVTNASQGLDRVLVRLMEIDEDGDTGKLTIKAEEVLIGTANAPSYPSQTADGTVTDFNADPGSVAVPVLFIPPSTLTDGNYEAWAAVASTNPNWGGANVYVSLDGDSYRLAGTVGGRTRYGVTTEDLPVGADPDVSDTLSIDLSLSAGALSSGTQADADAFVTLCWLGGELISYSTVTITGANRYDLTAYLRRGGYRTAIAAHPAGTPFVRLDSSVFKYPFQSGQVGQTIYVKFASFNVFGRNTQDLAHVTPYTLVLTQPGVLPGQPTVTLQSDWAGTQFTAVSSTAADAADYIFRIYDRNGESVRRQSAATPSQSFTYTQSMAAADGSIDRTYLVTAQGIDASGTGPESLQMTVSNPAPAAVTGVGHTGSGSSVTITWAANSETDRAGYVGFYSDTAGFDPTFGQGALFYEGVNPTAGLSGLTTGHTYYVRVAAYDTWSDDSRYLNFSAQHAFTA
jgi:hypothetical protein